MQTTGSGVVALPIPLLQTYAVKSGLAGIITVICLVIIIIYPVRSHLYRNIFGLCFDLSMLRVTVWVYLNIKIFKCVLILQIVSTYNLYYDYDLGGAAIELYKVENPSTDRIGLSRFLFIGDTRNIDDQNKNHPNWIHAADWSVSERPLLDTNILAACKHNRCYLKSIHAHRSIACARRMWMTTTVNLQIKLHPDGLHLNPNL